MIWPSNWAPRVLEKSKGEPSTLCWPDWKKPGMWTTNGVPETKAQVEDTIP